MKNTYTNEVSELHKWVEQTNLNLGTGFHFLHTEAEVRAVCSRICAVKDCINEEYPFYAAELPIITQTLFSGNPLSGFNLNPAAFGELFEVR